MDKKEFLSKLEKSLSVLEEDELRDIISEYEQHIDMKVERGLTEEEAIVDFGSFQELTAEILEAYHVRADYAAEAGRPGNKSKTGIRLEEADILGRLKGLGGKGIRTLWAGIKSAGFWIGDVFYWGWRQICRPFSWVQERWGGIIPFWEEKEADMEAAETGGLEDSRESFGEMIQPDKDGKERRKLIYEKKERQKKAGGNHMRAVERTGGAVESGVKAMGRAAGRIFQWGMNIVSWGIYGIWNCCWILFSLFAAGFGLMSLFGMGMLTVLLLEGYPLLGVTLGCLGLVVCMFSAAGLGGTLVLKREKERIDNETWEREPEPEDPWKQDMEQREAALTEKNLKKRPGEEEGQNA